MSATFRKISITFPNCSIASRKDMILPMCIIFFRDLCSDWIARIVTFRSSRVVALNLAFSESFNRLLKSFRALSNPFGGGTGGLGVMLAAYAQRLRLRVRLNEKASKIEHGHKSFKDRSIAEMNITTLSQRRYCGGRAKLKRQLSRFQPGVEKFGCDN